MAGERGMNVNVNLGFTETGLSSITSKAGRETQRLMGMVSAATKELTGLMATGGRMTGGAGGGGRAGGGSGLGGPVGGGGAAPDESDYRDALQKLASSASFNAELARRIGNNEEQVLEEHVKLKMAIAEQRRAFTRQFDIRTTEGAARTRDLAKTAVSERQQRLAQRAFEVQEVMGPPSKTVASAVMKGGTSREAAVKVMESARDRQIAIERAELDLAEGSAKSMARQKVVRDELNREIAKEVRAQENLKEIAEENAAVARRKVALEREGLKAVTDRDREQKAILAREARSAKAAQDLEDQKRMSTKSGPESGLAVRRREQQAAAGAAVIKAEDRQMYLKQFDVGTKGGLERTTTLATTAVGEKMQAAAQRTIELQQMLADGKAKQLGQNKALEAALAREVSIEQHKADLASGAAASMAQEKVQRDALNREVAKEVRAQQDIAAIAKENVAKERDRLAQRAATRKAETPEDRAGIARDKVEAQAREREIAAQVRAQQDVKAIAEENAAIARRKREQGRADIEATTPADIRDEARYGVEKRLQAAQLRQAEQAEIRSAAGQRLGMQEHALETQTAELKATRAQLRAADQKLIVAEANEAAAREEKAARIKLARAGETGAGLSRDDLVARAAVVERTRAEQQRTAIVRQSTQADYDAMAQRKLDDAKVRLAVRKRERELIKEAVASGDVGPGNFFQQLQFRMRPSQSKLPEEYLGFKQFMGEKAMTTFGFAASGMALGGGIAAISEMFKDATRLEQTFVRLRGQLEGLGKVDAFPQMREEIHAIAAETGQAADKVGGLVERLIGIRGERADPMQVAGEARSAAQLSTITGMDPTELQKSLVPIAKAFQLTTEQIGDGLVDLGEKTGAPEAELLSFFGKTAAAAHSAGLTFEEVQIIGGTMANALGGAFGSAGESINKVFTTVTSNADKIVGVLDQAPDTRKFIEPFAKQIGEGDPGQAYITLIRAYKEFNDTQKDTMLQNVVSRREAEDFYAVMDNADDVIKQIDNQQQRAANSQGKMADRWVEFKDTVQVTLQRIAASFESLGDALFRSGLGEFLTSIGQALQVVVGAIGLAVNAFAAFNEHTGHVPMTLLKIIGVAALLTKGYSVMADVVRKAGGASSTQTTTTTRQATAERGATEAKVEGAVASTNLTVAEGRLTAAKTEQTVASQAQARTVGGFPASVTGGRAAGVRVPAPIAPRTGQVLPPMLGGPTAGTPPVQGLPPMLGRAAPTAGRTLPPMLGGPQPSVAPGGAPLPPMLGGLLPPVPAQRAAIAAQGAATDTAVRLTRTQRLLNVVTGRRVASETAAVAESARTRIAERVRASVQPYDVRRAAAREALPALAEGETRAPLTGIRRAFAGGSVLRSARLDEQAAQAGQKVGATASPLGMAMITIAAAAVVKSSFDQQAAETQAAREEAQNRLRAMDLAQLRATKAATAGPGVWESVWGRAAGVGTAASLVEAEEAITAASDVGATQRLGGAARVQTKAKTGIEDTKQKLVDRKTEIGQQISQRMNDATKQQVAELFNTVESDEFAKAGLEMGLTEQSGFLNLGRSVKQGKDISPETIAKAREWSTQIDGLTDEDKKKKADFQVELDKLIRGQPDLNALAEEAAKVGDSQGVAAAVEASNQSAEDFVMTWAGGQDEAYKNVQILQSEFQTGKISQAQYIESVKTRLVNIEAAGKAMANTPTGQAMLAQAGQLRREMATLEDQSIKFYDEIATSFAMLGSLRPKRTKATMHAASISTMSLESQQKEFPALIQEEVDAWQEDTSKIFDPIERARAMIAGPQLSDTVKRNMEVKAFREKPEALRASALIAKQIGKPVEEVQREIERRAMESGKGIKETASEYIDEQIKIQRGLGTTAGNLAALTLESGKNNFLNMLTGLDRLPGADTTPEKAEAINIDMAASARKAKARIASARAGPSAMKTTAIAAREAAAIYRDVKRKAELGEGTQEDVDNAYADMITAQQQADNAIFQFAQLRLQRGVIEANRDPVKENAAQMRIAQSALANARKTGDEMAQEQAVQQIMQLEQQAAENQLNIVRGAMQVQAALDAEDPMKGAINALRAAEFELSHAHGEADRQQKEAAVISARQRLAQTVSSALTADAQLAITLANLRGDTVGAATVAAQNAKRLLDEAIAKGITDRNILAPLEAGLAEANKQLYLAPIQKQISDLDYLYGLEQISLGDYIAMLEAQLSALVYDSQEYRDLNMKIFNLKKTASADLGWTVPGNLELPTLYETRRAGETIFKAGGGPYQDNRNINVNIAVNGAQDPVAVANQVQTALNNSLRGGQTYTAGIPLAAGI